LFSSHHAGSVAGKVLSYTVSIGLAGLNVDENSIDPLIARGDEALYKAKKTGRNKVVIAEGS
jgi:diguanylate cyclase